MSSTFRNFFVIVIFTITLPNLVKAQPRKGKFINASIGLGITGPYDQSDISGSGFYAQGEYVLGLSKWFGIRPYAGLILTSPKKIVDQQNQPEYKVTSKAFLLGGKARILAPIPYVAPYFEIGVGVSMGSFQTYTPLTNNISKNGLIMHIPFSIGLALGRKHSVDFAFTYYYQPSVEQFSGAVALGFTFPLNK
jgi:hypothetical protein